jgi:diguanylate cyclase (GGDEF)-like protein
MFIDETLNIEQNYFDEGGIEFNPKIKILPDGFEELTAGNYYLLPIFLQKNNYGYLVCRFPTNKYPIYTIFLKILVNAFVHSYIYSKTEQERIMMAEKNQTLNFQSKTDELTQLFNRRGFFEYGQQLLDFSLIDESCGCVFFCDLDGLKTINDTWGHEIGDLAIKTEAKVLRAAFRDSDLIGRLSGDEFGVVAPGCPLHVVERIRERFKELNKELSEKAGLPFTLSISIGPIEYTANHNDLNELLKEADKNLYKEKKIKHAQRDKDKAKT